MKKFLWIVVLGLLLSGNAYAGVNEPGVTSIAGCEKALNLQHEKYIKNHLKELIKKKQTGVLYASCNDDLYSWAYHTGKDLKKTHKKAYKQCMKVTKKNNVRKDCYLYAVNEEIVWKYDEAKASATLKTELAEAKALEEKNAKIDKKPGRFFEDQPDVTNDYQIHFNYLLAADSKDGEMDINGKMEKILLKVNEVMLKATAKNKKGDGIARKYKFDYRADGKLDITFVRMDKKKKELPKTANNYIIPFLNKVKGQKNIKKIYFNFADFSNIDGGDAGVGYGTSYLKSSSMKGNERKLIITLHELLHTQGMGYDCVPGVKSGNGHYGSRPGYMLESGKKIGPVYAHTIEGCPQMMDSVYLTPTRNDPYDPYVLNCLLDLGKYNHPKLIKKLNKIKEKPDKQISWKLRYSTSCRYRDWERAKGGYYIWGVEDNIAAR